MTAKEKHKAYLKKMGEYPIDCNTDAFNDEEMECIRKYGYWYKALCDEILVPFTWLQEQFIRVYKGELEPFSIHEVAWTKYVGQKNAESKRETTVTGNICHMRTPFTAGKCIGNSTKSCMV
jgi:uncharacterized protein YifE (UPF0438 family)